MNIQIVNKQLNKQLNIIILTDLPPDILCYIDGYLSINDIVKMRFLVSNTLYSILREDWRLLNSNFVNASKNIQKHINNNILKSKIEQHNLNMACNSFRHKSHLIKLYEKYLNISYNPNVVLTVGVLNYILLETITYNDKIKNILRDQRYLMKCGGKLTKIFDYEFYNKQLKSIVIPSCIKVIGNFAFTNNIIEYLYIPKNVETIERNAFANNKLKQIKFSKKLKHIKQFAFSSNYLENITIPKSIETIEKYAFHKNYLRNVSVFSITTISEHAFSYNKIRKVTLSDTVKYIDNFAFHYNCLEKVIIPDTIKHIGVCAFNCNYLNSVILPDNIPYVASSAFGDFSL